MGFVNSNVLFLLPKGIKAGLLWLRVIEGITMSSLVICT